TAPGLWPASSSWSQAKHGSRIINDGIDNQPMASRETAGYRRDIDGLRAIAILGVVAYHIGIPGVTGGYSGVDVFFVISGYLITQLLVREAENHGRISIVGFYSRRIRRLLPALVVVLLASLTLGFALLPASWQRLELAQSALAASLFVANEFFRETTGNYFSGSAEFIPLLHLWSLAVEEQFYLVWPLVLSGVVMFAQGRPLRRPIMIVLCAGIVLSFALSVWLIDSGRVLAAFYFIGSRAWELGIGALLSQAGKIPVSGRKAAALSALGVGMVLAGFCLLKRQTPFPGMAALAPVLGTALIIWANPSASRNPVLDFLSSRPMVQIGLLSYGWYLWHWPLLAISRYLRMGATNIPLDILLALLALLLAWVSLVFIEQPFRKKTVGKTAPIRRVVATGVSILVVMIGLSLGLIRQIGHSQASSVEQAALKVVADVNPLRDGCLRGLELPFERRIGKCAIGETHRAPTIAVWGDSHADAWTPLLDGVLAAHGIGAVELTMPTCPPLLGLVPRRNDGLTLPDCERFNDDVLRYLQASHGAGLHGILLAARWPYYSGVRNINFAHKGKAYFSADDRSWVEALASLRVGLSSTLKALQTLGLRGLIVLSAPEFPASIPDCILLGHLSTCGVTRAAYEQHRAAVDRVIIQVAGGFNNVRVVDPANYFCSAADCPAMLKPQTPALYDDNHPSASAARGFGTDIQQNLEWLQAAQ
ncbi:MAG: acyltransferase family protein, partial [Stenotrophobium sp.]